MLNQKTHWTSLLILLCLLLGAGLFLISAFGLALGSIVSLAANGNDPAGAMIAAAAAGFEGILLAAAAWFVFQKTRGIKEAEIPTRHPFSGWHIWIALALAGVGLSIGAAVSFASIAWLSWLLLPAFTILVIVPPIWILSGLGAQGLDLGPRWRAWGIFGLGMTIGPLIMITVEITIGLIFVFITALFLVTQPSLVNELLRLAPTFDPQANPERLLELFAPYVLKPGVIAAILGYMALLVPMIEEIFKPLGVWLFARKIESPAQGLALGILSGAAYAIIESLGVSGRGGTDWAIVVGVRAGTSLLHITTTGLMGWAIVSAWKEKRVLRLIATYIVVVLIHGIWNASAVGVAFAAIANSFDQSDWLMPVSLAAVCGLLVLAAGLVALLITSNRRMRALATTVAPEAMSGKSP